MTKLGEGTPALPRSKTADDTKAITGSFNKVFLLQFDNGGKELLARIPCPVADNLSLSTASEAATTSGKLQFYLLRLNLKSA